MPEKLKLEHPVLVALLLALAVVAVYLPVAQFDFTNYDDTHYVTRNPQVLKGLSWEGVRWAFTQGYSRQLASGDLAVAHARLPALRA